MWVQGEPGAQARGAAKRLRDDLFRTVHPIEGCAVCLGVEADALVGFAKGVGCLLPKPKNAAVVAFFDVDKSAFVSRGLKLLKAVHSGFSMCLIRMDGVRIVTVVGWFVRRVTGFRTG